MDKIWFVLLVSVLLLHYFMACLAISTPTSLLALKSHITHDSSNVLAYNWSTSTSCCNWIGVTCGHRHHRVTALNLADMGLTGTIAPHLGNLSFLALLDMGNNIFHGHLYDQLAFLRRLKVINLRLNNFSGQIPSWSGFFPQLQSLNLSSNNFSNFIPASMYNMSSLQYLHLGYNSLSGSLPVDMCSHLPELDSLYLHHLEILSMRESMLKGSNPPAFFNMSSLLCIDLQNNSLSGSLLLDICNRLPALRTLAVYGNKIMGSIPRGIENCTLLEYLDLGANIFTDAIPHELGNLHNLVVISLDSNGLSGSIPPMIFNISRLETISLLDNNLSGQQPPTISLGLPNLEELYLWGNKLSGIIPGSISNASKFTLLDLGRNSFTGFLPTSIGNFSSSLEAFHANKCNIKGHIPREISNLRNLILLNMRSNKLTRPIPHTLGRLQKLQGSDFLENKLQGSIPYYLCLLTSSLHQFQHVLAILLLYICT